MKNEIQLNLLIANIQTNNQNPKNNQPVVSNFKLRLL